MIRRHPLGSFFLLAYGLSWLLWTPYVLSAGVWHVLPLTFPVVLGDDELFGLLPGAYLGPLAAAFLVTARTGGTAGLRRWRARLTRWRTPARWYVFALLGIPASLIAATFVLPGAIADAQGPPLIALVAYPPMLLVQILTTGLAEEPGWRDFALPRLQRAYGPLPGSVILGVLWSGWHLPLFLTGWALGHDAATLVLFFLVGVLLSIVITWVFNRTGQSLPVAALVHVSNNNALSVLWPAMFPDLPGRHILTASVIAYGVLAGVLLVVTRGRLGCPEAAGQAPAELGLSPRPG
ncbi:type II CAAX endopeptidase family protein [Actinoplanes sp. N902-109]|uniref:type II CAAX endopeptidase family protein n=1 Tax=Actinoplanes sp. (strain N902-109) TaxID=649831 RepID=UPI0005A16F4B|nr:type II CAAX endopeptidase family protein [Actinoplanes sp. N902-109]